MKTFLISFFISTLIAVVMYFDIKTETNNIELALNSAFKMFLGSMVISLYSVKFIYNQLNK